MNTKFANPSGCMCDLTPSKTLAITSKAKALKAAGEDVISFAAGEPDFDTPQHIKDAAVKALAEGKTKYTPESGIPELKKAVADKFAADNGFSVKPEQVVVAPGAKFSVFSAVAALCGPGDKVVISAPYWVSYPDMVKAAGAEVVAITTTAANNYEIDPAELAAVVDQNTKMLILNSPSNPTGAVYRRKTLEAIAKLAVERQFIILADEIYEKLVYDPEMPHVSVASLSPEVADLTVTVNGFSKAYSMTGWRLGYLAGPTWLVKRICALQSHTTSNPTSFAQYGALAGLQGDQRPVEEMRLAFAKRRDLIYSLMSAIPGVSCIRPSGAFYIFCDIGSFGLSAEDFCARLLEQQKVAAIPSESFGVDGHIRLSYACSEKDINNGVARIREFCATLK